ncbi:MAG: hypothetical protein A2283_14410 [Lentisphaerae bacterium RIFOXYA12_FULL_48_11]|nr:MAG: hypothetical protein A2283_14410 [Lentisphaerae bacterium RIFOXYA12_FULL_48_11]
MPRGDGTGPMGMGSMTGRAAGFCAGYGTAGYSNPMSGRGCGRGFWGRGGGNGRRNMFYATGMTGWQHTGIPNIVTTTPEKEIDVLRKQAERLGNTLEGIHNRIKDLESVPTGK